MPFDVNNPPDKIRNLTPKQQRQWVHVYNSCWEDNPGDEKKCHMQAWGVVKKSAMDTNMAEGCGCTQMGDCGCSHEHSALPTVPERIVKEMSSAIEDIKVAMRCLN